MSRLHREVDGANAVEFALVLPMLLMLVFGGITGGLLYNQHQQLTHAAREGARYGATLEDAPAGDGDCTSAEFADANSWCHAVRRRALNATAGLFDVDSVDRIAYVESDEEVIVRLTHVGELNIIFFSWNPELTAESVARYERSEED